MRPQLRVIAGVIVSLLTLTQCFLAVAAVPKSSPKKKTQPSTFVTPDVPIDKVPEVRFLTRGKEYTTYFTSSGMILAGFTLPQNPKAKEPPQYFELQILLRNTLPNFEITTLNPRLAKSDFFGSKSPNWLTNIPTYARVKYANVYPAVDILFQGEERLLDFDFVIAPGGDPGKVRFQVQGAKNVYITPEGALQLNVNGVVFELPKPAGYQALDETTARTVVQARYQKIGKNEISLQVDPYDSKRTLIIDQ